VSRTKRVALAAVLLLALVVIVAAVWLYYALCSIPQFYREALALSDAELEHSSREMLHRSAALSNDLKRVGNWEAVFTDQQINGWLAVDIPKNHPDLLPPEVSSARVMIAEGTVHAAAKFDGQISAIISIEADIRLTAPNELALRIKKARVGDVPWPLDDVIEQATIAASQWGIQIEQTQSDGDPVLLLKVPAELRDGQHRMLIERFELRDGEVYLAGQTLPAAP
jgi:hypothetical protein